MTLRDTETDPEGTRLPSVAALEVALSAAASDRHWSDGPIIVRRRSPQTFKSFFSSEVISCSDPSGREFRILCKYGAPREGQDVAAHQAHGHRHGVRYESMVYRTVLASTQASTPVFYGSHRTAGGETWLFVEHMRADRLGKTAGDQAVLLARAGKWLGRFHREWEEPRVTRAVIGGLVEYTEGYLSGWVDRLVAFAEPLADRFPWIEESSPALKRWAAELAGYDAVVIHGEFYPQNVLVKGDVVVPVDWESAAIGPPEIDLAALTEGWPIEAVEVCEGAYARERGHNADDDFGARLESARLYWDLRWLGDRPSWTVHAGLRPRLEHLRERVARIESLS